MMNIVHFLEGLIGLFGMWVRGGGWGWVGIWMVREGERRLGCTFFQYALDHEGMVCSGPHFRGTIQIHSVGHEIEEGGG